jgi:Uma2 family endonuclease
MATTRTISEEEFMALPDDDGNSYELVDGMLRVSPKATPRHGQIVAQLLIPLGTFVKANRLGKVFPPDTGFRMAGGNVRGPDITFVRQDRLPADLMLDRFMDPPDLAVEVLSPHDHEHPREFLDKVGEYIESGVRLVWVIDGRTQRAFVYRALNNVREVAPDGILDGEDVVPGFSCPLAVIFE